jgi:hypothetical protein
LKWKGHERVPLRIPAREGSAEIEVPAIAPVIISASRSTDIPAFYGDWFLARLKEGYVKWKSPFGGNPVYVSLEKTRVFVFWSKNPAPFFPHLDEIDRMGYNYYFLFTLNDYDTERLEPNVPPVDERIAIFKRLSERIGRGRVVWRFDPLVLSENITVGDLLDMIRQIGDRIHPYTERLVISFVDIVKYGKVQRNLKAQGFSGLREFAPGEVMELCRGLEALNRGWGLSITACGERRDLSVYGILPGQCISYDLMTREFSDDPALMEFLKPGGQEALTGTALSTFLPRYLKDPGQRGSCGCIVSKDIGQYSTCMHLCAYCYANSSPSSVRRHYLQYLGDRERGVFRDTITG